MITKDVEQKNLVVNSLMMKVFLLKVVSYPSIVQFLLSIIKKILTSIVQMEQRQLKYNVHHSPGSKSITVVHLIFVMGDKYWYKMARAKIVLLPQ